MLTERLRGELRCVRRLDGRRNTKGGREGKVAVMRAQYRDERSTDSRRRVRAPVLLHAMPHFRRQKERTIVHVFPEPVCPYAKTVPL